jgi:release factor glutamine methyltransferase
VASVSALLAEAKAALAAAPFRPSPREAHLLLGHVLGLGEARLLARDASPVPPAAEAAFRSLLARRLTGEPVARASGPRLALAAADLAAGLDLGDFDLLVSNPPYVAWEDAAGLSAEVRDFEPGLALFAEPAGAAGGEVPGAAVAARLLQQAQVQSRPLPPRARVALEIGSGQLEGLLEIAAEAGWRPERVVPDYAGIPRVVVLGRH